MFVCPHLPPAQCVFVAGCSDCTVVVGAAGRLVRLERCDKVSLLALCARLVVLNCHDCGLWLGTPRPPLLVGDCRFLRLAPFNTKCVCQHLMCVCQVYVFPPVFPNALRADDEMSCVVQVEAGLLWAG